MEAWAKAPFRIGCRFKGKKGLILLDQTRAVDKSRLEKSWVLLVRIPGKSFVRVCRKCLRTKKAGPVKTGPDNAGVFNTQKLLDCTQDSDCTKLITRG
jgi:hypothetical protein